MDTYFTLKDVVDILNVDRGRFIEWLSRGLIETEHEVKKGSRVHKEYSKIDIYTIAIFMKLIETGQVPRENAAKFSKLWRAEAIKYGSVVREPIFFLREGQEIKIIGDSNRSWDYDPELLHEIFPSISIPAITADEIMSICRKGEWDIIFVLNIEKILGEVDSRFRS